MTAAASTDTLTPSESVFIHGDQFAKKAMLGEKLLLTDMKVSASDLATAMVTAAILANEKKGLVTLALKKEKALFGLATRESLKITPSGNANGVWPERSTEADMLSVAGAGEKSVSDVVIAFLGGRVTNPEHDYIGRVKAILANKGFLTREDKKVLGLKVSVAYHVSDEQRSRLTTQGASEALSLLSGLKSRPEIANRLKKEIDSAFADRTNADSAPD